MTSTTAKRQRGVGEMWGGGSQAFSPCGALSLGTHVGFMVVRIERNHLSRTDAQHPVQTLGTVE